MLIDKVMLDFFKPAGTPSKETIANSGEYIAAAVSSLAATALDWQTR